MVKRLIFIMLMILALPLQTFAASSYIVSSTDNRYTYGDCKEDLALLTEKYPVRENSRRQRDLWRHLRKSQGKETDFCNSRTSWTGIHQQSGGHAHGGILLQKL